MTVVKFTVDSASARQALAGMSRQLGERVRKKAIRNALAPVRDDLRKLWKSAIFRGKSPHRKAIASATHYDVRRGKNGNIIAQVGVKYGGAGGKSAKGRQRVWHLLEHGFRHAGSGSSNAYSNVSMELRRSRDERMAWVRGQRRSIFERVRGNSFQAKTERRNAMKAMYSQARAQWAELASYQDKRRERVRAAMSSASMISGRKISSSYVLRNMKRIMEDISARILKEAKESLR